jgi:hypothetical protein
MVSHLKVEMKCSVSRRRVGGGHVPCSDQLRPQQGGQTMEGTLRYAERVGGLHSGNDEDLHRPLPRFCRSQARFRDWVRA